MGGEAEDRSSTKLQNEDNKVTRELVTLARLAVIASPQTISMVSVKILCLLVREGFLLKCVESS